MTSTEAALPAGMTLSLATADFHDRFEVEIDDAPHTAMELALLTLARPPRWVNRAMALRNRVVARLGLKNLGALGAVDAAKPASAYRVGDRVGIFRLIALSERVVVMGDSDRHLDVEVALSVLEGPVRKAALTTVVRTHNLLGRLYMLPVTPMHKLIVPAVLASIRRR